MTAIREAIVDRTLALAHEQGWEAVRLADVADELGIGMLTFSRYFAEKDDIIDAWLDRADEAMLSEADRPGFRELGPREGIRRMMLAYLEALAPYHRVTREMIGHKLEFGHVHVQFPALLRISRTVQWIRESNRRPDTFFVRGLEESVLTSIFVTTFVTWLRDDTPDHRITHERLDWMLGRAEAAARSTLPRLREWPLPSLQVRL